MDIFKENFPNNIINDLYKLCFQNYRASLFKRLLQTHSPYIITEKIKNIV